MREENSLCPELTLGARLILAAGVKVVCRLRLLDYVAKGKASHVSSSWAC